MTRKLIDLLKKEIVDYDYSVSDLKLMKNETSINLKVLKNDIIGLEEIIEEYDRVIKEKGLK